MYLIILLNLLILFQFYDSFSDLTEPYPSAYEPKYVEKGWYEYWEEQNLFNYDSQSELEKQVPFNC